MKISKLSIVILSFISALFLTGCTKSDHSEKLNTLLEKYVAYWNTGEFTGIEEVLHPDFELRMTPEFKPEKGIDIFKENIIKLRSAYPDFHIEIKELIYNSDKLAGLWTITATNTGVGTHPPTGKHIEVKGMSILHFEDGKIRDEWIANNNLFWMTQLGFKIMPPETDAE
jgi:predicted ester cyclase